MARKIRWAGLLLVCLLPWASAQEGGKYTLKTTENAPPKELSAAVQKLLRGESLQLLDGSDKVIAEVWVRKEVPTDATAEQIKNGITYREVKQSEVLGAVRFHQDWSDYRKQKVKAGVYTLRLAYQPTDGKHTADISEYQDFAVVLTAKADTSPELMEATKLQEASSDSIGSSHPGVFMLVPTKPGKAPEVVARPKNHWAVTTRSELVSGGKNTGAHLGLGINLVGHSPAE